MVTLRKDKFHMGAHSTGSDSIADCCTDSLIHGWVSKEMGPCILYSCISFRRGPGSVELT